MPERFQLKHYFMLLLFVVVWTVAATVGFAQTTAFSYQGRLTDADNPADGLFDMQFKLFNTPTVGTGTQQGPTIPMPTVQVSAGSFTVQLDFGANVFDGTDRYLEIAVRPAGNPNPHTVLSPRTQILTSPYSIRSISAATADTATNATTANNALNLGGVGANQFVQTNDSRLSDSRNPLPNSPNYIQNTTTQQASSNFNISGGGTVGTFNTNGAVTIGGVTAPTVAPTGQGRIYFDSTTNKFRISESGGEFINLVGSGAVSGAGTTNFLPLWSAATTLGNSAIAQSGTNIGIGTTTLAHRLAVIGGPCWTGDCWGGALELENGSAIAWRANTSNVKFGIGRTENGLFFFRTLSPLGTTTNGPIYDFKMDNDGRVGIGNIGISTDLSGARLNIFGPGYGFLQSHGTVAVGSFADSSGGWLGTKSNHPLYFFTNNSAPRMTMDAAGNVGIGTSIPTSKLEIAAQDGLAITGFQPFFTLRDTNASGARSILAGGNGDFGFYPNSFIGGVPAVTIKNGTGNVGIGSTSPAAKLQIAGAGTNGFTLGVEGDVTQNRDKGGFVKAMAFINASGNIVRCYNGFTGSSTGNCGFNAFHTENVGEYVVDFGFQVNDRFVSVTAGLGSLFELATASADYEGVNGITIHTFGILGSVDAKFTIIIY